jgi:hypothetical protein
MALFGHRRSSYGGPLSEEKQTSRATRSPRPQMTRRKCRCPGVAGRLYTTTRPVAQDANARLINQAAAVVGSIIRLISVTFVAGNPLISACR